MSKILPIKSTLDEKYINETGTITEPALESLIAGGGGNSSMQVLLYAFPSEEEKMEVWLGDENGPYEGDALIEVEDKIHSTIENGGVVFASVVGQSGFGGIHPCSIVPAKNQPGPLGAFNLGGSSSSGSRNLCLSVTIIKENEASAMKELSRIVATFNFPLDGTNGKGTLGVAYLDGSVDVKVSLSSDSNVANIYSGTKNDIEYATGFQYSMYEFLHEALYAAGSQSKVPVIANLSTFTTSGNIPTVLLHTAIYATSIILDNNNEHIYFYFDAPIESSSDGTGTHYSQKRIFVDLDNADSATYKIYATALTAV